MTGGAGMHACMGMMRVPLERKRQEAASASTSSAPDRHLRTYTGRIRGGGTGVPGWCWEQPIEPWRHTVAWSIISGQPRYTRWCRDHRRASERTGRRARASVRNAGCLHWLFGWFQRARAGEIESEGPAPAPAGR